MSHPFGDLLTQYRARKHGLTQARLAELAGYHPPVVTRMAQGGKDLTGPSGRERIVRLVGVLRDEGVLTTLDEANALLAAAHMPPLFADQPVEAALLRTLRSAAVATKSSAHSPPNSNLPVSLTHFIGRQQDIAEVHRLLAASHLVTLTGAGGIGKTRLALEILRTVLDDYHDGVWLVELAPLADAALVPRLVASVLNLPEQPGHSSLDVLTAFLRSRELLLLLDNCEHLINACAQLVDTLLRACPGLHVLATSREALNISGEITWRIPSLSPMDSERLFVDRARAARPEFTVTKGNAAAVTAVCTRLDGIPLAIELAAVRVIGMTVAQIAQRLDDRFALLCGGSRTALPRHQTLRGLIDWSYDLLTVPEQTLLKRLAVFAGGFTLELAEVVCADPMPGTSDILPILLDLVNKSLVMADERDGEIHYRLLETIRAYALEELTRFGDLPALQRRHAETFTTLAEKAEPHFRSPEERSWVNRIEWQLDDVRAALRWSKTSTGDIVTGLRLASSLWPFWRWHGHSVEGRRWLEELLALMPPNTPPNVRAQALLGAGNLAVLRTGDEDVPTNQRAAARLEEALGLFRGLGDQLGVAYTLCWLGLLAVNQIDFACAQALLEQSLAVVRPLERPWVTTFVLHQLAFATDWLQDYGRMQALYAEALTAARQAGDQREVAEALVGLGVAAMRQCEFTRAVKLYQEGLSEARRSGNTAAELNALRSAGDACRSMGHLDEVRAYAQELRVRSLALEDDSFTAWALLLLGQVECEEGEYRHAYDLLAQSLTYFSQKGGFYVANTLEWIALVASGQGQLSRAARLFGAAEAIRTTRCPPAPGNWLPELRRRVASIRAQLDVAVFDYAWAEGSAMTLDQALAYALQENDV